MDGKPWAKGSGNHTETPVEPAKPFGETPQRNNLKVFLYNQ